MDCVVVVVSVSTFCGFIFHFSNCRFSLFLVICHWGNYSGSRRASWKKYGLISLQWRHNERNHISNHQHHDCLLYGLFRRRSTKRLKLRVTDLIEGNSPVTDEFPAQRASNAENVSIWWRHHENVLPVQCFDSFPYSLSMNLRKHFKTCPHRLAMGCLLWIYMRSVAKLHCIYKCHNSAWSFLAGVSTCSIVVSIDLVIKKWPAANLTGFWSREISSQSTVELADNKLFVKLLQLYLIPLSFYSSLP